MNKSQIQKILLWCIIITSTLMGIVILLPIVGYILIICGILIPSYVLYINYYEE
jgi:hypothetical protein